MNIYKRDLEKEEFQYFKKLKQFYADLEIHETVVKDSQMRLFLDIIDSTLEQFLSHFEQCRKIKDTAKFIKHPDTVNFDNLDLAMFSWMELHDFEMQLIEL